MKLQSGEEVDTLDSVTSSEVKDLKHLTEVIDDAEQHRGVLTHGMYVCPKCEKHHKLSSRERFNIFFVKINDFIKLNICDDVTVNKYKRAIFKKILHLFYTPRRAKNSFLFGKMEV